MAKFNILRGRQNIGDSSIAATDTAVPQQTEKIGTPQIREAYQTYTKYKEGKKNLERRVVADEEWWKLHNWDMIREGTPGDPEPASAWLVNCILSKHADAMDSYPEPVVLPREAGDRPEATKLSSILPVILEQNDFQKTYSDMWWSKLKTGTGVYAVMWDANKLNGLGDICIKRYDLLSIFWEPGVENIQDSKNIFTVELVDNEQLIATYPELDGKLNGTAAGVKAEYIHDDSIDVTGKSAVFDWYYKVRRDGKTILHYCKFVGDNVLYATENQTQPVMETAMQTVQAPDGTPMRVPIERVKQRALAETGLYDHGMYPFVFDALYPVEGSPCGYGIVDICKGPQKQIDILNNAITKNAIIASTPRWFVRTDGNVNEQEYADWTKPFVHVPGTIGDDSIRRIEQPALAPIYINILSSKIEEMKETSGNRDVSNGAASGGVTSASGIAALQESGGKLSRDSIKASHRAYAEMVRLCIENIRQFYDLPRTFRITGNYGEEQFTQYDNTLLRPQPQDAYGVDAGLRTPVFDIEVSAQKESRYSEAAYNELAIQMYQLGFFNPQLTDQALLALSVMSFKGKDEVSQKIKQNGTLYQQNLVLKQQMLKLAQMVDMTQGTNLAEQIAAGIVSGSGTPAMPQGGAETARKATEKMESAGDTETPKNVERAKAAAQARTQPVG